MWLLHTFCFCHVGGQWSTDAHYAPNLLLAVPGPVSLGGDSVLSLQGLWPFLSASWFPIAFAGSAGDIGELYRLITCSQFLFRCFGFHP